MRILRLVMTGVFSAGTATMQARQLLITSTAMPLGEAAVLAATTGLATAYSLGSLAEFLLSPLLGKSSDHWGRKPVLLSLFVGPACMRLLCATVRHPGTRIRLLWLDFASARCIGIGPCMSMAGTMVSDIFPRAETQASARAELAASQALGQVFGNWASGWWNARSGPESTYVVTAAIPLVCFAVVSALLPETNRGRKLLRETDAEKPRETLRILLRRILADPECCCLALALGLYEFMNYAPMNSVSILFMKARLNWGPLQAGRFASGVALAAFTGSMLSSRLVRALGSSLYVTFANCSTILAYLMWGSAAGSGMMLGCLVPLALGSGSQAVVLTRFVQRAVQLGLSRGEAASVIQCMGACARMLAPQLFLQLFLRAQRAAARTAVPGGVRLPLGIPMLSVALVAVLQEILHQLSSRQKAGEEWSLTAVGGRK